MARIKVVPFIPGSAMTKEFDEEPIASHGQAILGNVIDPAQTAYKNCSIGSYIYRSFEKGSKVPYANHIKGFTEMNSGAHYYVMSEYTTSYSTVTARVKLSEAKCNRVGNRNGFISLSIFTGRKPMSQCDIGIGYLDGNDGEGWYPTSWSMDMSEYERTGETKNIEPYEKPNGFQVGKYKGKKITASEIEMEIQVKKEVGYDWVCGSIYAVTNGTRANTPFATVTYRETAGGFFSTGHINPYVRFTRFMSLVPLTDHCEDGECRDYADGSTLSGIMRNCRLGTTHWNNSKIAFAWSVQGANIKNLQISQLTDYPLGDDIDKCVIEHSINTHGTPTYKTI